LRFRKSKLHAAPFDGAKAFASRSNPTNSMCIHVSYALPPAAIRRWIQAADEPRAPGRNLAAEHVPAGRKMRMTILSHFAFCARPRLAARGGAMADSSAISRSSRGARRAFSLLELLAVMAIIAILLGLLTPAISAMTSTAGRKGAVNILMNTFEQARVAALESGRNVYVVLWRRIYPEQDAIMVLRDPDPAGTNTDYEQLTRWIKLPKGVLLHTVGNDNILVDKLALPQGDSGFDQSKSPVLSKLSLQSGENLHVLAFNAHGGVAFPASPTKLMLIVSEGVRGSGGTEALISNHKEAAGGFEIISLRRYTGRPSLEVTTL
jgi:prepilin-type N-terminal cleavage/methylation domain-containing protein